MRDLRRLTIIAAGADPGRLRAALEIAAAVAALDRPVRLFLQGAAAGLLRPLDMATAGLLAEAQALGVEVTACQTGLAEAHLPATDLPPGVATGGLIGLLGGAEDDQLLMA